MIATARTHRIALIPGDGIGTEVMPGAVRVLDAVASRFGFALRYDEYDWSCARLKRHGAMMPEDGLDRLRQSDVILLGTNFGPTEPAGKTMSMAFGKLNASGGWRRLNVAVTRARREMTVFTSFDPGRTFQLGVRGKF